MTDPFHISTGLDILPPKAGKAFPIPCDEWEFLKAKLKRVTAAPMGYQEAASLFSGVSLSTLVTIWTGAFVPSPQSQAKIVAWAVVAVSGIVAIACYFFARKEKSLKADYVQEVITQMEIIERRYDQPTPEYDAAKPK